MDPRTRARSRLRLALPLLLAVALATEASGAALAVPQAGQPGVAVGGVAVGGVAVGGVPGAIAHAPFAPRSRSVSGTAEPIADFTRRPDAAAGRAAESRLAAIRATPAAPVITETIAPKVAPSAGYRGTNRLWIPSLGVNRPVSFFSCSSTAYPGNRVYRWGCAGANNVYLFGHASSVFKPLHDAYARGRLRKGMEIVYADGNGRISRYAVSWWKVTPPDGDVAWAYAGQSVPSMTLQTCVGSNSEYRLVVRLVRKG